MIQRDLLMCACYELLPPERIPVLQVRSMAAMYGFSAQCTAVGTSYFARLAARDER